MSSVSLTNGIVATAQGLGASGTTTGAFKL